MKEDPSKKIETLSKKMFKEWKILDTPRDPSPEELEFFQNVERIVLKEASNEGDKIKIKHSVENRIRSRKDLGEIIVGNTIIKKIEIIDEYEGYNRPLNSIGYYKLFPTMDAKNPITRILQWTVSHHQSWVIWFTSPIAKGIKTRTSGEYVVVHSLNEKESEDYDLLLKFSKFPCFGRRTGIDVLLGYEKLEEAVEFVERFLPIIVERNLYSDSNFLSFLRDFKQAEILP
ncbi:MAG: hypothetical protein JSV04_02075, partial [Candidatus Heimdallarchaeota archaeon]